MSRIRHYLPGKWASKVSCGADWAKNLDRSRFTLEPAEVTCRSCLRCIGRTR